MIPSRSCTRPISNAAISSGSSTEGATRNFDRSTGTSAGSDSIQFSISGSSAPHPAADSVGPEIGDSSAILGEWASVPMIHPSILSAFGY